MLLTYRGGVSEEVRFVREKRLTQVLLKTCRCTKYTTNNFRVQ